MRSAAGHSWVQGVYYLATGLWAGAVAMVAIAAPSAFYALRNADPPTDRADELAGLVANRMVDGFLTLALICAGVMALCVVMQSLPRPGLRIGRPANVVRLGLLATAFVALLIVRVVIVPAMHDQRAAMYDPARTDAQRLESRVDFMRLHKFSERLIGANGLALVVAVLISPYAMTIVPRDQGAEDG